MKKNIGLPFLPALVCSALLSEISAGAYASDSVYAESRDVSVESHHTHARHEVTQPQISKCRRNGVVWSGGVASRFSDRISPRPIRSRWDRVGGNSIRCVGVDAFKQHRVSDLPLVR